MDGINPNSSSSSSSNNSRSTARGRDSRETMVQALNPSNQPLVNELYKDMMKLKTRSFYSSSSSASASTSAIDPSSLGNSNSLSKKYNYNKNMLNTYRQVIRSVLNCKDPIDTLQDCMNLKGVGSFMGQKMLKILQNQSNASQNGNRSDTIISTNSNTSWASSLSNSTLLSTVSSSMDIATTASSEIDLTEMEDENETLIEPSQNSLENEENSNASTSILKKRNGNNKNHDGYVPKQGKSSWAILHFLAVREDNAIKSKEMAKSSIFDNIKSLLSGNECSDSQMYHGLRTLQKKKLCEFVNETKLYRLTKEGIDMYQKISSGTISMQSSSFSAHQDEDQESLQTPIPPPKKKYQRRVEPLRIPPPIPILKSSNGSTWSSSQINSSSSLSSSSSHEWELVLLIDSRENSQYQEKCFIESQLLGKGIIAEMRSLPLGDYLWIARKRALPVCAIGEDAINTDSLSQDTTESCYSLSQSSECSVRNKRNKVQSIEFVLDYIIERKTMDDLCESIIDGRYREQKKRLQNCGVANVVYLLEGDIRSIHSRLSKWGLSQTVIESVVADTQILDGFAVHRLSSINDTLEFLERLHLLIQNSIMIRAGGNELLSMFQSDERDYQSFKQKNSKSAGPISLKSLLARQLRQIPGCGASKADAISQKFGTPRALYDAMQIPSNLEMLSNIIPQNQEKRVGPALASNVQNVFTTRNPNG